jgi:hypothetical protein
VYEEKNLTKRLIISSYIQFFFVSSSSSSFFFLFVIFYYYFEKNKNNFFVFLLINYLYSQQMRVKDYFACACAGSSKIFISRVRKFYRTREKDDFRCIVLFLFYIIFLITLFYSTQKIGPSQPSFLATHSVFFSYLLLSLCRLNSSSSDQSSFHVIFIRKQSLISVVQ